MVHTMDAHTDTHMQGLKKTVMEEGFERERENRKRENRDGEERLINPPFGGGV